MADERFQEFATVAALVLSQLYASFPIRASIDHGDIMSKMNVASNTDRVASGLMFKEVMGATVRWLVQENFIDNTGNECVLTARSLMALRRLPQGLGGPTVGDELQQVSRGDDANQSGLAAWLGEFLGNFAGGVIKSSGSA